MFHKILHYPLFLLAAAGIVIVLSLFEMIQRICFLFGRRCHERSVFYLCRSLWACLKLLGTKLEVSYCGPLPASRQIILASNHQSMFDIVLLTLLFDSYRPKFIAKKELCRGIPSVSYNLNKGGHVIIERGKSSDAVEAIKSYAVKVKEEGASVVIFPEGTRSRTGELREFKSTGTRVLLDALPDAPVLPVAIDNSWIFTARPWGPVPFGLTLRVMAGPALNREPGENKEDVLAQIRACIESNLSQLRDGKKLAGDGG